MGFFNNHDKYSAAYNGVSCNRYGLFLVERPNIPTAEKRILEYDVLGVDGKKYIDTGLVEDRTLEIKIGFFGSPDEWCDKYRAVKRWLKTKKPDNLPFTALQFADDTEYYYKVKKIVINTTEREAIDIGKVDIEIVIDGYNFKRQGFVLQPMIENQIYNQDFSHWSPIVTVSRDYDSLLDRRARARFTSYYADATTDWELTPHGTLDVSLERGTGMILDLSVPSAYVVSGANPVESGFNQIYGDFGVLQNPYAVKWETFEENPGAEFSVEFRPLYKER